MKSNPITKDFFFKFGLYGGISYALASIILHYVSDKSFNFVWLLGGVVWFLVSALRGPVPDTNLSLTHQNVTEPQADLSQDTLPFVSPHTRIATGDCAIEATLGLNLAYSSL